MRYEVPCWRRFESVLAAIGVSTAASLGGGNLEQGFTDHGVPVPVSTPRGVVATQDGQGHDVVLVWLFDHRGGYALLLVDAATGSGDEYPMPFQTSDCPYASILSSRNRFYTMFGAQFVEFDPVKRAFTFVHETTRQMAMAMTEDDRGRIWSVAFPQSAVCSYDPETGAFRNYGSVHSENWAQYPRWVATDDSGWLYIGIGQTRTQIIAFDPETAQATPMVPEVERGKGYGFVYRAVDGKVYGQPVYGDASSPWYAFHRGQATRLKSKPTVPPKVYAAESQPQLHSAFPECAGIVNFGSLIHRDFPSGRRLRAMDLNSRIMVVERPGQEPEQIRFDYSTEGAELMSLVVTPRGDLVGGSAFPMNTFRYRPASGAMSRHPAYRQWNAVTVQEGVVYAAAYGEGVLLEWDPAAQWVRTLTGNPLSNPRILTTVDPVVYRPHCILAHPDGNTLIMGGTPAYGHTGGGLLFWDRSAGRGTVVDYADLLPEHSTVCMTILPDGRILGGTTVRPGTGGEQKAEEAELYLLSPDTRSVVWHAALLPGIRQYSDLVMGGDGRVWGVADNTLFSFDPGTLGVVDTWDLTAYGGPMQSQGPRLLLPAPDGAIYGLMREAIMRIATGPEPDVTNMADTPVEVTGTGAVLDGRLYFIGGSHLYSYELPTTP